MNIYPIKKGENRFYGYSTNKEKHPMYGATWLRATTSEGKVLLPETEKPDKRTADSMPILEVQFLFEGGEIKDLNGDSFGLNQSFKLWTPNGSFDCYWCTGNPNSVKLIY